MSTVCTPSPSPNFAHVRNLTFILAPDPEKVKEAVREHDADVLFTASMWTPEESLRVRKAAVETKSSIKTFALPQGLQVNKGPDAVVEFIVENLPGIIDGDLGKLEQ